MKASSMNFEQLRDAIIACASEAIATQSNPEDSYTIIRIPYGSAKLAKVWQVKPDGTHIQVDTDLTNAIEMLSILVPRAAEKAMAKMSINGRLAFAHAWLSWYQSSDKKDFYSLDWKNQSFERCVLLSKGVLPNN
jgi:hypothetical protein